MAAEIPVDLAKEQEQVKKTLVKFGKYFARYRKSRTIKAGEEIIVYNKTVKEGPLTWYQPGDAFVLGIPFELSETEWGDWGKSSYLKCHYDEHGNLNAVYNLL